MPVTPRQAGSLRNGWWGSERMLAPIALFVYNRPHHTRMILQSLIGNPESRASDLYVFSDGPKDETDENSVAEVRRAVLGTPGFRSVEIIERERNIGLATSIIDGVTRLTASHGKVIVIEDDLVLAPRFLEFVNRGLEHYQDEMRVMQVSGYMYPADLSEAPLAGFLPSISCWGWGTWARAWSAFDPSMSFCTRLKEDRVLRARFDMDDAYDYFGMLEQQRAGRVNSWGIVWNLSVFAKGGLVLCPRQSLVSNAGFDGSGTHAGGSDGSDLGGVTLWNYDGPFEFPDRIEVDGGYYEASRDVILAAQKGWRVWARKLLRR